MLRFISFTLEKLKQVIKMFSTCVCTVYELSQAMLVNLCETLQVN